MTTTLFSEKKFYFFAILFSSLAGAAVAILGSPWLSLAAILGLFLFTLLFLKPHWGIYFLVAASACTAVSLEVLQFTIRPEQIVTLILAVILLVLLLSGKRPARTTILDLLIVAYLLVNVVSSLYHAPDIRTS